MTKKNDGGSAFPRVSINPGAHISESDPGMSLRDWFAGKALQGHRSRSTAIPSDVIASWSYNDADAMLKEREK